MKLRYMVVEVEEGGASFHAYPSWDSVPFSTNPWHNLDGGVATKAALEKAELGDEIELDGNSVCFVLKG